MKYQDGEKIMNIVIKNYIWHRKKHIVGDGGEPTNVFSGAKHPNQ